MYSIPSLADLLQRARQAFRTYLPGSDAWSWPNNIYASAKVVAGMAFEVFGFASYISKMIFVSTAPDIETLKLHGNEFNIPQLPSAPAGGNVTFVSTDAITVATSATIQRADGVAYLVTAGGVLATAGTLQVPVTAAADGALSNSEAGTPLTALSGVTGPGDFTISVGAGDITQGADVEGPESYRQRILFRKRNPPQGGAPSDYVIWAKQISGVSRVFVERLWAGSGTVRVFIFMDGLYPNGIPDATAIERAQEYIESVAPSSAAITVAAGSPVTIDVTVANLAPNTTDTQEAILNELRAAFLRLGRVAGSNAPRSSMPFLATPAGFPLAWIYQAISNAAGVASFDLPSNSDTSLFPGQTAVLGNVTFV